jgi:proteasome lid subunit RPN8/RPN11
MLELNPSQLQQIKTHAEQVYPHECCGILIGRRELDRYITIEAICTANEWEDSNLQDVFTTNSDRVNSLRDRYIISPIEILHAQQRSRDRNLDIIGFFHSHPDCAAVPSEFDRRYAWDVYSYPIVSVIQGTAVDIRSWRLDIDRIFQPEEIITEDSG